MPRNLKRGGSQFSVSVSAESIGEDQKKGLHVFRRPIYPPKLSEDQKKDLRVLRCPVFTVPLTGDIVTAYISAGGGRPQRIPLAGYAPELRCIQWIKTLPILPYWQFVRQHGVAVLVADPTWRVRFTARANRIWYMPGGCWFEERKLTSQFSSITVGFCVLHRLKITSSVTISFSQSYL